MSKRVKRGLIFFILGFVVFFILGFLFENLTQKSEKIGYYQGNIRQENSLDNNVPYNIATSKVVVKEKASKPSVVVDQKYERIAAIDSKTKEFNQDEKKLRDLIKKYNALIQFEKKTGLEGSRYLDLAIGVNPLKFDEMTEEAKTIGKMVSIHISKNDKTNEYKDLNAKKESLLKTRASLLSLKNRGGNIAEFISLENRILEIEEQIQKLGVRLGEYDEENEFCTVKFTLMEKGYEAGGSVLSKIKNALEWSIKYYAVFLIILLMASLCTIILLKIWDKVKLYFKD